MSLQVYNRYKGRKEEFQPVHDGKVGIYFCGMTVQDKPHMGHMLAFVAGDMIRRYLKFTGYDVKYVQNFTDVDDKIISKANDEGIEFTEVAQRNIDEYFRFAGELNIIPADIYPRATEHIDDIIGLISKLEEKGFAYKGGSDVYYRVRKFPAYGKLSGRIIDDLQSGARIEVGDEKEDPLDFTLWKGAKEGEPAWDSPWGPGRPGWHIECSVMSMKYLGETLDMHGGGMDLVFPHHENEIAQSGSATGKPFFRFWLHNGMLSIGGEKMSKSLGNFDYAKNVLASYDPETVRYFYLSRHYRKPLDYSDEGLQAAQTAVTRIRTLLSDVEAELRDSSGAYADAGKAFVHSLSEFRTRYVEAMDDDLNTVAAIGVIQELVSATNRFRAEAMDNNRLALRNAAVLIKELGEPLGLFSTAKTRKGGLEDGLMTLLIELRKQLREKREFELADRIRDQLAELGITLKDTAQGTIWTSS